MTHLSKTSKSPATHLLTGSALGERIYERYYYYGGRGNEKELPDMLPTSQHSVFTMLI